MGIRVIATRSETQRLMVTVRAWSLNICPATPSTKTIGRKTATVVRVEAITAGPISAVPSMEASRRDAPCWRLRKIDSSTTMDESSSMPRPSVRPPSDIRLSETSILYMNMKVAITEMGIEVATIRVLRISRRKKKRMMIARAPPMSAALRTSPTAWDMKVDWSKRMVSVFPSLSFPFHFSMAALTISAVATIFASPAL